MADYSDKRIAAGSNGGKMQWRADFSLKPLPFRGGVGVGDAGR
jgi:hypothetical protein